MLPSYILGNNANLRHKTLFTRLTLNTKIAIFVINERHHYDTRTAGRWQVAPARLATANSSWRSRAAAQYAALSVVLREEGSLPKFLAGLRRHTTRTVGI